MDTKEIEAIAQRITLQWVEILKTHQRTLPLSAYTSSPTSDAVQAVKQWASSITVSSYQQSPPLLDHYPFLEKLRVESERSSVYEDKEALESALEYVPLQRIYEEAEIALANKPNGSLEDEVVCSLMHWFKNDFFTWVDEAPCDYCSGKTGAVSNAEPSTKERQYGADVVEIYKCMTCYKLTRFARYNDPVKLLETRRGRCGEWANCFTLCCRAVGADSRFVWDKTDHVWTEIYSEKEQRWVHCDPCEDAFDRPLLYSEGWSKKLSYCIAFSAEEVVDVTKRYTRGWPAVLERRNLVDEPILIKYISNLSQKKQTLLDKERRTYLSNRRKKEEEELDQAMRRTFIREDELIGRESGSLEWRINRKEYGDSMKEVEKRIKIYEKVNYKVLAEYPGPDIFQLQGTAQTINNSLPNRSSQLGSIFRLTEDKPAQCGGVFMKQPFDLNSSHVSGLQVEFSFRITNQLGGPAFSGADGFAFVIQTQKEILLGQGGCELGFGGLQSSLAIEFDTYKSSDRCDDPSDNHISIQARLPPHFNSSHHDYSLGHTSQIPSMKSGEWIDAKVTILTKEQHIQVCLREKTPSNNAMEDDYVPVLLEKVLVKDYLHYCSDVIIGFTASTGGLAQNHDIIVTRVILCQQE